MAGRVMRDVERKMDDAAFEAHKGTMLLAEQILIQKRFTKGKIYSLHAPEVECIAKGKAHKPYEFGVKVSLAVTHKEGFVVGIQACPGNPYDGPHPGRPARSGRTHHRQGPRVHLRGPRL
jgi:IS5 family transposase